MRLWIIIGGLLCAGCQLTVPPENLPPPAPPPSRPPAAEVWNAVAAALDAQSLTSTRELAQLVVILTRNGDLSARDAAEFDAAFPGITRMDRTLTSADRDALRRLK